MKKEFFDYISDMMETNEDIYLILVGLGFPRVDEMLAKYPDRVINTEASEQTATDIAVGLAYAGKQPWVYTITPFYWRAAETLRTYINREKLHVTLVGVGVDKDYAHDGFSHDATDIKELFGVLKNFTVRTPKSLEELKRDMLTASNSYMPTFINVRR